MEADGLSRRCLVNATFAGAACCWRGRGGGGGGGGSICIVCVDGYPTESGGRVVDSADPYRCRVTYDEVVAPAGDPPSDLASSGADLLLRIQSTGERLFVLLMVRSASCWAAVRVLVGDGGSGDMRPSTSHLPPALCAFLEGVLGGVVFPSNSGSLSGVTERSDVPSRYLCEADNDSPIGSELLLEYPGCADRAAKMREWVAVEIGTGGRGMSPISICASILKACTGRLKPRYRLKLEPRN